MIKGAAELDNSNHMGWFSKHISTKIGISGFKIAPSTVHCVNGDIKKPI